MELNCENWPKSPKIRHPAVGANAGTQDTSSRVISMVNTFNIIQELPHVEGITLEGVEMKKCPLSSYSPRPIYITTYCLKHLWIIHNNIYRPYKTCLHPDDTIFTPRISPAQLPVTLIFIVIFFYLWLNSSRTCLLSHHFL